jgi:hypothetical protein
VAHRRHGLGDRCSRIGAGDVESVL